MAKHHIEDEFAVAILGSNHSRRVQALEAALSTDWTVVIPTGEQNISAFGEKDLGRLFYSIALPTRPEPAALQEAARSIQREFADRWITIGMDDYICEISASLSNLGGIPTFPKSAALTTMYKNRLRNLWNDMVVGHERHLVPVACALLSFDEFEVSEDEIAEGMKTFRHWQDGAILKPNSLDSSVEVHRVDDFAAGLEVIRSMLGTLHGGRELILNEHGIALKPEILVEEAIPRRQEPAEFSVEVLSIHGEHKLLGVTEKRVYPETHVETGHTFPAQSFPESLYPHLVTALEGLLDGLKAQNCISHWEFIVTPDERLALVEGQLRPAGDGILILCGLSLGRDPYQIFLEGVSGAAVQTSIPAPSRIAVVRGLAPEEPMQQVEEIVQTAALAPGERLAISSDGILGSAQWQGPKVWNSRHAAVMTTGSTQEEAEARCAALAASVVLKGLDRHGQRRESRLVIFDG